MWGLSREFLRDVVIEETLKAKLIGHGWRVKHSKNIANLLFFTHYIHYIFVIRVFKNQFQFYPNIFC